jgi:hypothetical protein
MRLKEAAALVLRGVAKHSGDLAGAVVEAGAVVALRDCLEEFDCGVKEAAAVALGHIATHTEVCLMCINICFRVKFLCSS